MNQFQQKGILALVGVITLVVSCFQSTPVDISVFRNFGVIALLLSATLLFFDVALWKSRLFFDWLVPVHNLNGTWDGSGKEQVFKTDDNGNITGTDSLLTAKSVVIGQSFSAIHLKIIWDDDATSEFKDWVPFTVAGKKKKVLTFSGVYDYQKKGTSGKQPRNILVNAEMDSNFLNNRPKQITLTYAAGDRQGVFILTNRKDTSPGNS